MYASSFLLSTILLSSVKASLTLWELRDLPWCPGFSSARVIEKQKHAGRTLLPACNCHLMPVELAEPLLPAGGAPRSLLARLRSRCPENFSLVATAGTLFAIAATCWFLADALAEPPSPSPEAMENATLASACTDRESCLRIVDAYMENQPRQDFFGDPKVGLLQTFGPNSVGGGPCGDKLCKLVEPCPNFAQTPHCRYDVYDNALAAIYLAKRGKIDAARQILDAFITLLYPPHSIADITIDAKDGLPSNRSIALLAAGFTDAPTRAGMYAGAGVADGALDTGNNAWVGMAFAHFAAASGEACYADVARDILYALKFRASCDGKLGGFASRFKPYPHFYRSTEHNIDMFALSTMLVSTRRSSNPGQATLRLAPCAVRLAPRSLATILCSD